LRRPIFCDFLLGEPYLTLVFWQRHELVQLTVELGTHTQFCAQGPVFAIQRLIIQQGFYPSQWVIPRRHPACLNSLGSMCVTDQPGEPIGLGPEFESWAANQRGFPGFLVAWWTGFFSGKKLFDQSI